MAASIDSTAISPMKTTSTETILFGGCVCTTIRYRLTRTPLFVHCCHCTYCQRETGSAFVLNAIIEAEAMEILPLAADVLTSPGEVTLPKPLMVNTPSESGMGQLIARCPDCHIALWSEYSGVPILRFVRVGTLDEPGRCPPGIHIFTDTKQEWVNLDGEQKRGVSIHKGYYDRTKEWPKESLERRGLIEGEVMRFAMAAHKAMVEKAEMDRE